MVELSVTDFHNHLVPGVDDGAQSREEARAGLEAMYAEGARHIIVTPHFDGSLTQRPGALAERLEELDAGWRTLGEVAAEVGLAGLELGRGVELKLDTPRVDLSDPRLRLNGGSYVLMEFPFMSVPPQSTRAVEAIRNDGWTPIIAHPERYNGVDDIARHAAEWRRAGAYLQVNAASLIGRYGPESRRRAMELLANGLVDFLASDFHARGKPRLASVRDLLLGLGGEAQARLLLETNPARMVAGEPPLPVTPLRPQRRIWTRIKEVFGRG